MALKDIFTMVKADRYTADGCEVLNKAREADVEDRRYNIGEISEKTGLQKTANGWVKPKNGKQAGAKENDPLSPAKRKAERIAKMQKETGKEAPYGRTLKGTPKTPDDNPLTERTQTRAAESKPAAGSKPAAEWETKGKYQLKRFEDEKTLNNFLKENGFVEQESGTTSFSEKGAIHETVYKKGDETLVKLTGPGINKPTIRKKNKVMDSAPRVLTGDTKIRVRKA